MLVVRAGIILHVFLLAYLLFIVRLEERRSED